MIHQIRETMQNLIRDLFLPTEPRPGTDTVRLLVRLAQQPEWSNDDLSNLNFLAKKVEVTGQLFTNYDMADMPGDPKETLDSRGWALAFMVFLLAFENDNASGAARGALLKRLNTLFKCYDHIESPIDSVEPYIGTLNQYLEDVVHVDALEKPQATECNIHEWPETKSKGNNRQFRVLPITVLFYEGPIARAYLETLLDQGCRPARIVNLVSSRDLINGKFVGRWLPGKIRTDYAARIQQNCIHYWPRNLSRRHPDLVSAFQRGVETCLKFPSALLSDAQKLHDLTRYSDTVETVLIESLKDESLPRYLRQLPDTALLFTGGGIVPAKLLGLTRHRFIHVHPGYLPDIRGADCVLWSSLLNRRLSASCFYMAPGIDTGDIISRAWLPEFAINYPDGDMDTQTLYRCVFCFLDPWVRAYLLRQLVNLNDEFRNIDWTEQNKADGETFHFMHEHLRAFAISSLFNVRPGD